MPTFIYIGHDGPRGLELRKQLRGDHLAHIEALDAKGRIRFAGPLRDEQGQPCGSAIVFDADDLAAAKTVAESDPYVVGGVFEQLEVRETLVVFPRQSG